MAVVVVAVVVVAVVPVVVAAVMAVVVAVVVAVVAVVVAVVLVVVNRGEGDREIERSPRPARARTGAHRFRSALARTGSLFPGAFGAMATIFTRIELDYC